MKVEFEHRQLHVTALSGKLSGFAAVTSSALQNDYCAAQTVRGDPTSICTYCYACRSLKGFRRGAAEVFARNGVLLRTPLANADLPRITGVKALRFNSHGELGSVEELDNFERIALHNRHLRSALWTKRLDLVQAWEEAHSGEGPSGGPVHLSMKLIVSSPTIGVPAFERGAVPENVHHVYTVYRTEGDLPDDAYVCRGHCADCMVCYTPFGAYNDLWGQAAPGSSVPADLRFIATVLHT